MTYLLSLIVDGMLAGAVYAPIALAFVVVYRASRMVNFALGEWAMLGAGVFGGASHLLGFAGGAVLAEIGMVSLALVFNRLVLRPLVGRPVIALIMVTLGLGAVLRGVGSLTLSGVPRRLPLPVSVEPLVLGDVVVAREKLIAALIGVAVVAAVGWFVNRTRTGLAMRALADDQQIAMAMGIDLHRYFALTWAAVGVIAIVAGTLWMFAAGGGLGVVLIGLRVFPIVIIGGLDSIAGTIVGAFLVGLLESLASGYVDPWLGGGFSTVAAYLVLIGVLFVRPYGLFGRPAAVRV
jgi:branched-chain amino acid transport system permease protein